MDSGSTDSKFVNGLKMKVGGNGACSLKLVAINDVYEIDRLPSYATCKELEMGIGGDLVIGVLPGDFVAPSLLSSLDKGFGMVDCMSKAGIDYVCIGNHEADIPLPQLHDRIRQSKFVWVNSNMQSLPLPADMAKLPEYVIVEVKGGGQIRRVALLGLNTEDPNLLQPGAFGGCTIEPLLPKALQLRQHLKEVERVDIVIPMTHQIMPLDRELAKRRAFPLILGGHDHEPYLETVDGCTIVKSGIDGQFISVINVIWPNADSVTPQISVSVKDANSFAPHPVVAEAVATHKQLIKELERSALCQIPEGATFSSMSMRLRPTTVGTFLCNAVRDALGTEVTLITAGNIRANRSYDNETAFTYAHLKSEFPFPSDIVTIQLPGQVICDMITFTRAFALQSPPVEKGGFLQTDDGVDWDKSTNTVLKIAKQPVQLEKMYTVAINYVVLKGLDNVVPIVRYKASLPLNHPLVTVSPESGGPVKNIIVAHYSKLLLYEMLCSEKFSDIDTDGDGVVSKAEFVALAKKKFKGEITNIVLDNLFNVVDEDRSGSISTREVMAIFTKALPKSMRGGNADGTDKGDNEDDESSGVEGAVMSIEDVLEDMRGELGEAFDEPRVRQQLLDIDKDGTGTISSKEFSDFHKSFLLSVSRDVMI